MKNLEVDQLIISKERVREFAEVFTPQWMVEKMCDVDGIKEKTFDIDATFLEPSAGRGVFLIEILKRKLSICQTKNEKIRALKSIYGVEMQKDNVKILKENLLTVSLEHKIPKKTATEIIEQHIICGDFLEFAKFMKWGKNEP
jgi:hypothetical protein